MHTSYPRSVLPCTGFYMSRKWVNITLTRPKAVEVTATTTMKNVGWRHQRHQRTFRITTWKLSVHLPQALLTTLQQLSQRRDRTFRARHIHQRSIWPWLVLCRLVHNRRLVVLWLVIRQLACDLFFLCSFFANVIVCTLLRNTTLLLCYVWLFCTRCELKEKILWL